MMNMMHIIHNLEEYYCICKKSLTSSDGTQWLSCIVGNVGNRFLKAAHWSGVALLKHCCSHYRQFKNTAEPEIYFTHPFPLQSLVPTLPTMQSRH